MDEAKELSLIHEYSRNRSRLYNDWYFEIQQYDGEDGTEPFAKPPSVESIIERFKVWFDRNKALLREQICTKWQYHKKKKVYKDIATFILSLASDCLNMALPIPVPALVTVTILVIDGYLDSLCSMTNL